MTQVWNNNAWTNASVTTPNPNFGMAWPGAIDPKVHDEQNLGPDRPSPEYPVAPNEFLGTPVGIIEAPGVEAEGLSWENHDVAYPVFDGDPVVSVIHEYGSGSSLKAFETPANIGRPFGTYTPNQSYAPAYSWDSQTSRRDSQAVDYVAHDQNDYGLHDSGYSYGPAWYDDEYPALYPNVAAIPPALAPTESAYAVSGLDPQITPRGYASVVYTEPADPTVTTVAPNSQAAASQPWEW
jgi:hypothetical protein